MILTHLPLDETGEGVLFVVATPIGNLADISERAISVLKSVDMVAAEDTRHSARLLSRIGAGSVRVVAYHDHNEKESTTGLVSALEEGKRIALISDAGTPLVSDPGYRLVCAASAQGIRVVPVPGPSAIITALSAAALPTDRFCFEGFLPAKSAQRKEALQRLADETRTVVLYEAPHRIAALMEAVASALGEDRRVTLCRELTKQYEQFWYGTAGSAVAAIAEGAVPERGEFVVVIEGSSDTAIQTGERHLMEVLLSEVSPATAASLASQILGKPRKALYQVALSLKKR
ncbi:MAG: 16S rRNA (cytidine(1402)-2'-O)-methyltransferase [Pseudomonadales bacterium]|nr:16S rRNA (cytidine(1402)-2'-O)-methyltransferase [Pseudomonadales bacterium]